MQQKLIFLLSGDWKSELRVPVGLGSEEGPLPGLHKAAFLLLKWLFHGVGMVWAANPISLRAHLL